MIPTSNHEPRGGARVRLVVLHTTEGARDVDALGAFFQRIKTASYHAAFDDQRLETFVPYDRASWSIRAGNRISDNAALCGFASWTRAEWLRHGRMLDLAAQWVAARCVLRGVPIRRLSVAETAAAVRDARHPGGVIMHRDYTYATGDGTHTDCGDHFPWDVVLSRAAQIAGTAAPAAPLSTKHAHEQDEDDMQLPATTSRRDFQIPTDPVGGWRGRSIFRVTANTDGNRNTARVYGVYAVVDRGSKTAPDVRTLTKTDGGAPYVQWWPAGWELPAGTTSIVVNYLAPEGMVGKVETER